MVKAEEIAKVISVGGTTLSAFAIVKWLILDIVLIALVLFFILVGLPWYFGAIIIIFPIILTILQIIKTKRIATALQSTTTTYPSSSLSDMQVIPGEKIIDFIGGIMAVGFTGRGFEWLGKGEMAFPQNALIITNKRVIFITVPVPGAGKIIEGTHIGMWQWLLAKKDIEDKLKEMLSSQPLEKIFQCHPKNFFIRFEDLKKVKMSGFQRKITFITKENKKYSYSFRDKKDFEKAKKFFHNFL